MGKGTKRKVTNHTVGPKAKRTKPQPQPLYFPHHRNMEDLWQQVFPVGTEWDKMDLVYQYKWDFSNLEKAFEKGGKLYGQKVYLFGSTESEIEGTIVYPVVVAVVSPFPPSDKIGIKSVQRVVEEIVPMKLMKMDWIPYIPVDARAGLRHLKIERIKTFDYCLPYFYNPFKEDEHEQSTNVHILYPAEPNPVVTQFDWKEEKLQEFTDELFEEEKLSEDQKDAFQDFVKDKVREAKQAKREAREARMKAMEEMNEETKSAFQNMKFYKFYPVSTPDTPVVSKKCSYVNRYYGKADQVL